MVKPPVTSASEPDLRIGIDVGGTWIKGAIINLSSGTPISGVRRLATPSDGTAGAVSNVLKDLIEDLYPEDLVQTPGAVGVAISLNSPTWSGPIGSKHGRQLDWT